MSGTIKIVEKPKVQPLTPGRLELMQAYRVVEVHDDCKESVSIGDIVVAIKGGTINATRGEVFFPRRGFDEGYHKASFKALRAFDVAQVVFAEDTNDRPQ